MSVIIRPSAAAAKLLAGEDLSLRFTVKKAPADAAVSAFVLNDSGGMVVTDLETFHETRVDFTEAELQEFPAFPPSIRERARKEGHIELVSAKRSSGGPIPVETGDTLIATVELSAAKKGGAVISGQLVLEGQTWGRNEAPIAAVVGRGEFAVAPVPTRIGVNIVPGAVREREVAVYKAPTETTAIAVVDTASPHVRLARLMAWDKEHHDFTEEEIRELPRDKQAEARRNGYDVDILLETVGPGQPVRVPRHGMLQAYVTLDPPAGSVVDLGGTLTIESTNWRRIDVPIAPVVGDVKVSLSADRVEVLQGEGSGVLIAHLESLAGPDTDVRFEQWFPEGRWTISPESVRLPAGGTLDVPLNFAAPSTTDPGSYRLDLKTSWFDGRGDLTFPLTLVVATARLTVTPLQPRLAGQQGTTVSFPVEIRSSGPKIVNFTARLVPPGVKMLTPAQNGFPPGSHVVPLEFVIDRYAYPLPDHRVNVDWRSIDGASGTLELRLEVQFRLEERAFDQQIITEDGVPLRGSVRLLVRNDGTGSYTGHMSATGLFSYNFRIRSVVHSRDGRILVVGQESGSVSGSIGTEDSVYTWNRPVDAIGARLDWPGISNGAMIVNNAFKLGGLFGTLKDLVGDTIQYMASRGLLANVPGGQVLSAIVFIGSELGDLAGIHDIAGPGGIPGILIAAGAAFVVGPTWLIPVFVGTALIGEATIQHRPLNPPEEDFVNQVFGGSLDFSRIRITNLTGANDTQFTCPSSNDTVLVNLGQHVFDNPIGNATPQYPAPGQVLIHELVHAWQIQHRSSSLSFLWDVVLQKLGADGDYGYGAPGPPWSEAFGLEAQGSVVDEWFAGVNFRAAYPVENRKPMNVNDPYFRYIRDNIQAKQL